MQDKFEEGQRIREPVPLSLVWPTFTQVTRIATKKDVLNGHLHRMGQIILGLYSLHLNYIVWLCMRKNFTCISGQQLVLRYPGTVTL